MSQKFDLKKVITEVRGVEMYASTVVVKRHNTLPHEHEHKRSEIYNLSSDSLGRLAFIAFNTPVNFRSMMTLTYPANYSNDGDQVKSDLNRTLEWYRYHFPGAVYLWWLEFQKRGAPHYHLLSDVDHAERGKLSTVTRRNGEKWQTHWDTWKQLEQAWERLGGGHTAWEVINDQEGGKKYAAKYATKAYQKAVPKAYRNVGRFWGHSRQGVKPEPTGFYECGEAQLREALKRGRWEHLPNDGEMLYRELFQAAQAIDLSILTPTPHLDPVVYPKREQKPEVYHCGSCGQYIPKWAGQCPACGQWHTLILQDMPEQCQLWVN